MAVTNLDVIKGALRKLGVLASGSEPRDTDTTNALVVLQSIYLELIENGSFGRLNDVLPTGAYTAKENDRIINPNGYTITLPATITDPFADPDDVDDGGFGTSGSDPRPPGHQTAIVVVSAGILTAYAYNSYTASWTPLTNVALTDAYPFSPGRRDGFSCFLAVRLADEYGGIAVPSAETAKVAARTLSAITGRWDSPQRAYEHSDKWM